MSLAAVLIPPSLDAKQTLRLRRFGVASLSYVLATAMVAIGWLFGVLPATILLETAAAFIAVNLGLYLVIRSGINLRFKDPSLTRVQILAAITILMYIVYHMSDGRSVALFACFIVFQFGVFRLNVREFTVITLYTLAAYALVINLMMHFRPQAIHDVQGEWMSWLGLAGFLPCLTIVSSQINALRGRMRDSAQKLRLFADNVPVMAAYWDVNFLCRFANKAFAAAYGVAVEDLIGKHARDIFGEEVFRDNESHAARVLQGYPVSYQRKRTLKSGETRYLEMRMVPDFGEQDRVVGCFAVTLDITEHKLAEEGIQHIAHHDGLTGLPNRLLFNDRLLQAISLAKRGAGQIALLYLDLDGFKPVNDALGHTGGDELLQSVAGRIRQLLRDSDTVARVGGDEFTVILPGIGGREEAEGVAHKIIAAVAEAFQIGSGKLRVNVGTSIGIAVYPEDGQDADALIKAADAAMYRVKQARGERPTLREFADGV
jgi:diguanylate cyclase (GGDEF)-like protein/PAS domain S-box-containing protein